jgi:hypothetical protein
MEEQQQQEPQVSPASPVNKEAIRITTHLPPSSSTTKSQTDLDVEHGPLLVVLRPIRLIDNSNSNSHNYRRLVRRPPPSLDDLTVKAKVHPIQKLPVPVMVSVPVLLVLVLVLVRVVVEVEEVEVETHRMSSVDKNLIVLPIRLPTLQPLLLPAEVTTGEVEVVVVPEQKMKKKEKKL